MKKSLARRGLGETIIEGLTRAIQDKTMRPRRSLRDKQNDRYTDMRLRVPQFVISSNATSFAFEI